MRKFITVAEYIQVLQQLPHQDALVGADPFFGVGVYAPTDLPLLIYARPIVDEDNDAQFAIPSDPTDGAERMYLI